MYLSFSSRAMTTLSFYALSFALFFCENTIAQNTEIDPLTQARTAIAKQEWRTAEALLQPLAQSQPQNPFVVYELAQVYENTSRIDAAKSIYRELTHDADLAKRQPTIVIRSPYASRMVSLLTLAQARLHAIEAKQLAPLLFASAAPPQPAATLLPEIIAPKAIATTHGPNTASSSSPLQLQTQDTSISVAVSAVMKIWADAWVRKDLPKYYASYTENYRGEFLTAESWKKQRQINITKAQTIKLDFKNVEMTTLSPSRVRVQFMQTYASNLLQNKAQKTLTFTSTNGRWLIDSEVAK
jgi:hypothetical protein